MVLANYLEFTEWTTEKIVTQAVAPFFPCFSHTISLFATLIFFSADAGTFSIIISGWSDKLRFYAGGTGWEIRILLFFWNFSKKSKFIVTKYDFRSNFSKKFQPHKIISILYRNCLIIYIGKLRMHFRSMLLYLYL